MASHLELGPLPSWRRPSPIARLGGLLLAVAVAGCGGGSGGTRSADSQVAATVNDSELTVHQVQAVLERQPRLAQGDREGTAAARVLEGLIDQELGAQAARAASLEKDPRVVQRLEAARREILAQAWQESVATSARAATSDEIDRYYEAHPALFAQRRIYVLQESAVEADAAALPALTAQVGEARTLDELSSTLRRAGLTPATRVVSQAAEDIPLALLERLAPLEPGRSLLVPQGGTARIFTVLQAIKAPVDRRQAQGAIAAFLANQRKGEAVADAMKGLRAKARIGYQGSFAASAPAAGGSAPR